ncbi:MAG: hypothetical protein KGL39_55145 [Patescibacteria group bacterium]|nr:hypothetical protein [Patescibacteria group bacterium]
MTFPEHQDGAGHLCQCSAGADHCGCVGETVMPIDWGEIALHRVLLADDKRQAQMAADRDRAVERARKAHCTVRDLGAGVYAVTTGGREHRTSLDPRKCDCSPYLGDKWCVHMGALVLATTEGKETTWNSQ